MNSLLTRIFGGGAEAQNVAYKPQVPPDKCPSIQEALDLVEKAEQGLDGLAMRIGSFMSLNLQTAEIYKDKLKSTAAFCNLFASYLTVAKKGLNAALAEKEQINVSAQ